MDAFTLRDHDAEARLFTGRVMVIWCLVVVAILVLVLRLFQLQVVEHERHAVQSDANRIQVQPIAPTRGLIYDRNGILLAENVPVSSLTIVRERVPDLDATLTALAELVDLTPAEIERFQRRLRERRRPFEPVPLRLQLGEDEIARIAVNRYRLPGVEVEAQLIRHYPFGEFTAHAIGSIRRIARADLERLDPVQYSATRYAGRLGVERHYEQHLHGQVGYQRVETDARGRITRVIDRKPPVAGKNIQLHLDLKLQLAASAALGDRRGAIVAIDPSTGGILALVSKPAYDPNLFIGGIDPKSYAWLRDHPDTPMFNRAVRGQYAPGSTFKPIVGLAGLNHGETNWERTIRDPGYFRLPGQTRMYRDWNWRPGGGGQGIVGMQRAIYRSSNTYFYDLGVRLGIERLAPFAAEFGFGERYVLDLPEAVNGLMPTPQWKRAARREPWYPGDTVNLGIGQGDMLVTPLQLAGATAILAARGQRHTPRMLLAADAELEELKPMSLNPVPLADPKDWERMAEAMSDVIHRGNRGYGQNGTAWAHIGMDVPYRMAGKSGTAQVVGIPQGLRHDDLELTERQQKHAWFIAFAPLENPEIALAVLVENGGGGSSVAGPVAREVLDAWLLNRLEGPIVAGN
ncbi:MAG: penicillin-binding protein 2 [Gammaproteobacteria bacterium]|nr:MAG: penicillin-binding protein 2 [Gammaproteobacteria bacterium]